MNILFYTVMSLFIFVCIFLILLVLIQKGRGGGLSSAFGGAGGSTAFGSKTGDVLTWTTSVVFLIFLILAVSLNLLADYRQKHSPVDETVNVPTNSLPRANDRIVRMIVSMTGFGDATSERDGTHYAVEIRSLNNRFFKPIIKLPDNLSGMEPELESMLREKLGRGSITYILKMRNNSAEAAYHINVPALKSYLEQLQQVKGLDRFVHIDLAGLVQLPGVCQEPRDETDEIEQHGALVRELSIKAIARLDAMRRREGEALFVELMKHVKLISESLTEIQKRAPQVIEDYHRRLSQRINQLLAKAELQVSQTDLVKEVAVFAERADICEEIQRLNSHLNAFEQSCRTSEHGGRKLDFIAQEMLREANTIASKANDAEIARHCVEIKGAIDRVKEQVQNVE